jgi:hypothetical protein
MLVLHDGAGWITGLQLFPLESELYHVVVDDQYFSMLQPFVGKGLQLDGDGENFFLPSDIEDRVNQLSLEQLRAQKFSDIERVQTAELKAGVAFDFGGMHDVIQTRNDRDLINISGITTRAVLLQAKGINDAVIEFRAESNTSYMITPAQAIALGEAVALHSETIYAKAWAIKDAIQAATTVEELEAIQW